MSKFPNGIRLIIKGFLRIALRVYYRSIQVQGRQLFPEQGPVLLIANHPNSFVDPAVLVDLLSQPIYFGANHKLFSSRMSPILQAFGAIPLHLLAQTLKAPLSMPLVSRKRSEFQQES